jgi:hypothetical protein
MEEDVLNSFNAIIDENKLPTFDCIRNAEQIFANSSAFGLARNNNGNVGGSSSFGSSTETNNNIVKVMSRCEIKQEPIEMNACVQCNKTFKKAGYMTQHNNSFHSPFSLYHQNCPNSNPQSPMSGISSKALVANPGSPLHKPAVYSLFGVSTREGVCGERAPIATADALTHSESHR